MKAHLTRRRILASGLTAAGAAAAHPALARLAHGPAAAAPAPAPDGATPSARQWAWHGREYYGFVHFSMNTFTDKEWGYGDEDIKLFNPTDFNPDQIVAAAKAGGMHGLILTAKHHDGFCLWPTPLTEHCIRNTPYKGGKGDIVREMADACHRAGMPFGLYLSPWDRNHAEYGRPAYIDYYRAQLTDLCTNYGSLFEVWFDGANGGDGYYGGSRETRKIDAPRYYNWPSIIALVHKLQPMACTFDPLGADIRWVGNEDGKAGDPCWPTMPNEPYEQAVGNSGLRGGAIWWPAETDVSIRPGWFYHEDEDTQVKSPARLMEIYDQSVGRGTNLLLNIPPDRRGQIAEPDVAALTAFGDALRGSFAVDLARKAVAHASTSRGPAFAPAKVLDGQRDTYWSTQDGVTTPELTLDLAPGAFDTIRLREYLPLGVRVTRFAVDLAGEDGAWHEVARHESIGAQRIIRLPAPQQARRLRLRILEGTAAPAISEVALFRSVAPRHLAPSLAKGNRTLDRSGWRVAQASAPGAEVVLDGNAATAWHAPAPGTLTLDMGRSERLAGFALTPTRHAEQGSSPPARYTVEWSADGQSWQAAGSGEFSNIAYARATQRIHFSTPVSARWLRFAFPASSLGEGVLSIAEISAFAPDGG
ncbi:alpha-L-fucosidase [Novosphingobium sp.]|uniref:alpha-L-fucosidase n=1 Tax=Novosphingobium sp. TaxID=1874826 RepID=UPI0031DA3803